jgi:hypothetical protein
MVHEVPGKWRFVYTTNRFGHRGPEKMLSNDYSVPHVVILGDSYSFGIGVNDDEEYAAVMQRAFAERAEVVNLSSGGWGLTQEIRRFYELGQLYQPRVVIIEFCVNDPPENVQYPVTSIHEDRFVFHPAAANTLNLVKKYLGHSLIQKSQLYNLLRYALWDRVRALENPEASGSSISDAERQYALLLDLFARDLQRREIKLVLFEVPGALTAFPFIQTKVSELEAAGLLRYIDVSEWVGKSGLDRSPEGHWGPQTHRAIGKGLAEITALELLPGTSPH